MECYLFVRMLLENYYFAHSFITKQISKARNRSKCVPLGLIWTVEVQTAHEILWIASI